MERIRRHITRVQMAASPSAWQSEAQLRYHQNTLRGGCFCFFIVCLIMSVVNVRDRDLVMFTTTLALAVAFLGLCLAASKKRKVGLVSWLCVSLLTLIFTWYLLTGGKDGFSALWVLFVPIMVCLVIGYLQALVSGTYFLILIIVLFYTPLSVNVSSIYTQTFMERFPVAYLCSAIFSWYLGYTLLNYEREASLFEQRLIKSVADERNRVESMVVQTMTIISDVIDARDEYTAQHSSRVASCAVRIAEKLGWSEAELQNLHQIALLHDIGKIGISDQILLKKGSLTQKEYGTIKRHTEIGAWILRDVQSLAHAADSALMHHERYDGSGYPLGLSANQIPIEARIISVADCVDAMNSSRVYRSRRDQEYIVGELRRGRGRQFDPQIADVMIGLIQDGLLDDVYKQQAIDPK